MPGRYPAVVKSYDAAKRTCRVEVPGLSDGSDTYPEAEIEYPIGDKSKTGDKATEIVIAAGEMVWVAFIGGDPRHPIITGYRNPQSGNGTDWRRFHHKNLELIADTMARMKGKTAEVVATQKATVKGATIDLNAGGTLAGVVQGTCICAYTGSPHVQVSATVKASL